jgi:hypothetical protein
MCLIVFVFLSIVLDYIVGSCLTHLSVIILVHKDLDGIYILILIAMLQIILNVGIIMGIIM